MSNERVIGKCSKCIVGDVVVPTITMYAGPIEDLIRCKNCGARKANNGPVIPMK